VAVRPARERIETQIEKLGPAVRRLRRERGLTLEELAGEVGSSVAHLSRLESGEAALARGVVAHGGVARDRGGRAASCAGGAGAGHNGVRVGLALLRG